MARKQKPVRIESPGRGAWAFNDIIDAADFLKKHGYGRITEKQLQQPFRKIISSNPDPAPGAPLHILYIEEAGL